MARNAMDGHDASLEDAMSTIARQALRITRLENENAALRAQLDTRRQVAGRPKSSGGNEVHPAAVGMYPREQYEALEQQCKDIQSQFDQLQTQHAGCEDALKRYLAKCKEYKDYAKGWKDWKDREMAKRKLADLAPDQRAEILLARKHHAGFDRPQQGSDDNSEPPLTPVSLPEAGVESNRATSRAKAESPVFPSSPPRLSDRGPPRPPSHSGVPRVTSSQTTADDTPDQADTAARVELDASSDNEPVFVSARSLKRRGGGFAPSERPAQRIKQEPRSPEAPIELSSSPRGTPERQVHHQISDLDAIGTRMITPRRPQRISELRERASSEEAARPRPSLTRNVSSYSEGDDRGSGTNYEDQQQANSRNKDGVKSATRRQRHGDRHRLSNGALANISVNVPTLPRTSHPLKGKSRLRRTDARDKARLLSEDGEDSSQAPGGQNGEAAQDDHLEALLNEPPPERTPFLVRRAQDPVTTARKIRPAPNIPTPGSIIKRPSPQKPPRRSPFKRPRQRSPRPLGPENEPLRSRPLSTLRLDDFKVNPKYMGTTFAFSETFRGREARRGLRACTRPDCCGGALQKIIAMGGPTLTGKTDAQALEAFLGQDWQAHMGGYNAEKRKEIVTQAHVFLFANEHGKHKSAFERRSTPPGFWDTDFPTTQQIEENSAKVDAMETQQVEERWREAMREGGRWLFRDE